MEIEELLKDIPEREEYRFYINNIDQASKAILHGQLTIGFCLDWFNDGEKYLIFGYKNLAEFSMALFKLKRSSTYNYLKVYEECAEGVIENDVIKVTLLEEYEEYSSIYQLIEILKLPKFKRSECSPDMSVRDIREKRKNFENSQEEIREWAHRNMDGEIDTDDKDNHGKLIREFRDVNDLFNEDTKKEVVSFFDDKDDYVIELVFKQR